MIGVTSSSRVTTNAFEILGARAHAAASKLAERELVDLLASASAVWDGMTTITAYFGGKRSTREGQRLSWVWQQLGEELVNYSTLVVAKGDGAWITPALSSNGRCRDSDIEALTQLCFDADGVGDWDQIRSLLEASGVAHLVQRSASHTPSRPKWHLHIPLATPATVDKPAWRRLYRHTLAWLSAAAGLDHDLHAAPARYGFDPATDRLGQPWFPAARRSEDAPVPETVCVNGLALDLDRLLALTGFDPVGAEKEAAEMRPVRRKSAASREKIIGCEPGSVDDGLLALAFERAGMLGPRIGQDKRAVICPWSEGHTTGETFDSSTVVFATSPGRDLGWFHCSHAHCQGKTPRDVLCALPPTAVKQALASAQQRVAIAANLPNFVPQRITGGAGGRP
jgi:hypothetical protein